MASENRIESPCFGLCKLDEDKLCVGCRRSKEEIGQWTNYTDEQRRAIVNELDDR